MAVFVHIRKLGCNMRERPILFSAPMVRALLNCTKSQTRRIVKPSHIKFFEPSMNVALERSPTLATAFCPYGQPGDRLWVRETWGLHSYGDETNWLSASGLAITKDILALWDIAYRADFGPMQDDCHWRPSIHMPRWASRILLEITAVRVERLADISEEDAKAEGADCLITANCTDKSRALLDLPLMEDANPYRNGYALLWESINGDGAWFANPWVWVVEFQRAEGGA